MIFSIKNNKKTKAAAIYGKFPNSQMILALKAGIFSLEEAFTMFCTLHKV
jgi:hypothetical protein